MAQRLGIKSIQRLRVPSRVLHIPGPGKRPQIARLVAQTATATRGALDLGEVDFESVPTTVAVALVVDKTVLRRRGSGKAQACFLAGDGHVTSSGEG